MLMQFACQDADRVRVAPIVMMMMMMMVNWTGDVVGSHWLIGSHGNWDGVAIDRD